MRSKLFVMMFLAGVLQVSCGGTEEPEAVIEASAPDFLPTANPHEGIDLGPVVSSGIVPSENVPPPPESDR